MDYSSSLECDAINVPLARNASNVIISQLSLNGQGVVNLPHVLMEEEGKNELFQKKSGFSLAY